MSSGQAHEAAGLSQVGATYWPLECIWISTAFFLVGGGPTVSTMLLTTIVADVVPVDKRYDLCD